MTTTDWKEGGMRKEKVKRRNALGIVFALGFGLVMLAVATFMVVYTGWSEDKSCISLAGIAVILSWIAVAAYGLLFYVVYRVCGLIKECWKRRKRR